MGLRNVVVSVVVCLQQGAEIGFHYVGLKGGPYYFKSRHVDYFFQDLNSTFDVIARTLGL
jgi:hypothetical protein